MAELLRTAISLKEAASLKGDADPFTAHMRGPAQEVLVSLDAAVKTEFETDKPQHERLDKLLSVKHSLGKAANVELGPEDELWREEVDDAVRMMDQ